ncbi:MAG: cation-translocating P-type ATPase [Methyloceanibacter sp.]
MTQRAKLQAPAPRVSAPPFALPAKAVLRQQQVNVTRGLSEAEAASRLKQHGPNALVTHPERSWLSILADQIKGPVMWLLAAAAAVAALAGEWAQAAAILLVLVINALIGFFTEFRAVRSMEALRKLGSRSSRVRREGRLRTLPAEQIVPGDIVVLESGDVVTADIRLVEAKNLFCDESTLTGESVPVEKGADPVAADAIVAERASMLHKGTAITRGLGIGVAVATGMETELGLTTKLVLEAEPDISPLERKLAGLTRQLVQATVAITALITAAGMATGRDLVLMVEAGIALAVAAIPEGLPIVATMALARGMWRMARRNVVIERLAAVETLGATTVICTDKTGTLTENRMTVERLWLPSGDYQVDRAGKRILDAAGTRAELDAALRRALEVGVLCGTATLENGKNGGAGDPMELALLRLGQLAKLDREALLRSWPEKHQIAFDTETKMMATAHARDGRLLVAVKGAPESVLAASTSAGEDGKAGFGAEKREEWLHRADALAEDGLRVLALAEKTIPAKGLPDYDKLTFLGLVGFRDPPRLEVKEAIAECREAGIRVVMVTGDHAVTARKIAEHLGISAPGQGLIEGRELEALGALGEQERQRVLAARVFARVTPAQKLELVLLYQSAGQVVAMTGDGVNDAPALQTADIGIAMGLRGTEVAREAADIVLRDDAFGSIVAAIREGRVIFGNLRRFLVYLLSCNISEVMVVALAVVAGLPLPLLPLQILFLNLVTDVFPAFALATGEGEKDILQRPPRDPRESLLGKPQWWFIAAFGVLLTGATLAALAIGRYRLGLEGEALVTVSFLTLAFAQLWHVFNMRGEGSGRFRNAVTGNPYVWMAVALCVALLLIAIYVPPLANALQIVPPDSASWSLILIASLVPVIVGMLMPRRLPRHARS